MRWILKAKLKLMPLLNVQHLSVSFAHNGTRKRVVQDLSFVLEPGETLGLVGESGSGKSVSCLALLGLLPQPPAKIEGGLAFFEGVDLLQVSEKRLGKIRGQSMGMVFQDPSSSLNPYLTIGSQLAEGLIAHTNMGRRAAWLKCIEALEAVGIADAELRLNEYPHVFSGGMRQRVMIAMALLLNPRLLIADEPTTALDVTVQAQILSLLKSRQATLGTAMILVTHDLGVAARMCDRLILLKQGKVEEAGTAEAIFYAPQSLYAKELLAAVPTLPTIV